MSRLAFQKTPVWSKALKACADADRVLAGLSALELEQKQAGSLVHAGKEQTMILCALFSGSLALGNYLVRKPGALEHVTPAVLKHPRRKEGLASEVEAWLEPLLNALDFAAALRRIRMFKEDETLRIAARDLARLSNVQEITLELSDLADVCLDTVWRICSRQAVQRYGAPYHKTLDGSWEQTGGCVFGMGKLGGQELNYSSDVDVLFAYAEEGMVFKAPPGNRAVPAPGGLTSHQFFNRLAEAFIAEVSRMTQEGSLYRIDLRLRPEGNSGPLTRSLSSYENYYAQWGQTWERMMLIKARRVAGDTTLAGEFLETIQPFRYARSTNVAALREVASMKDRIEAEVVKSGELDSNVKLGRGGIREIEFIVQSLQLLHAGRQPFLQTARTLAGLEKLVAYEHLEALEARKLYEAYCFLREVEHRLQMEDNRQTHTIPTDKKAVERLARLMGFKNGKAFETARATHAKHVRSVFERILHSEATGTSDSPFPKQFENEDARWKELLRQYKFRDPEKAFRVLREFVEGPGYVHVSARTSELAHGLIPRLFALCPGREGAKRSAPPAVSSQPPLSDPDRVITRLDSFITAYGARATLFELWHSNPSIFELLVLLFDRSEFLAELAIRTPDLVDELVTSDRLRQRKTSEETLRDLLHGIEDKDQAFWIRRYHQAELMRIGLRDILGLVDPEQYLVELSALADACLSYALEVIARRHKLKQPPFSIIGLGKLGGQEIDYGSDLDIIFVSGPRTKDLAKTSKMAVEMMDLLSKRTEHGIVFQTDARLRPDGQKGLLVNSLKAYEEYYRGRALLWELQALSRARWVAGDTATNAQFNALCARLTNFRLPSQPLAAYSPDWKRKIHEMRLRIQKERTPAGKDHLAIKTGAGGLVDAEFVAQALCLEHGWREPNTLRALERGKQESVLPDADALTANYRLLRRIEGILRRWSYEGESVLPSDPEAYYRVSVRCGYETPDAFAQALTEARGVIRAAYAKVFG